MLLLLLLLILLLLTLNNFKPFFTASFDDFEQVNVSITYHTYPLQGPKIHQKWLVFPMHCYYVTQKYI